MPHVTLEYSALIAETHDMQAVCDAIFANLAAHPAIPHPKALKIRALPCPFSTTGATPDTFAHAHLMVLPGRDGSTKTDLAQTILNVLEIHLPDIGSLSVDLADLSPAYTKRTL